ncbi:MAG: hypothetical protein JNK05_33890 [Myxococcales bacterium]|nr:hypothetical protein [Myxococcales bacterium]
MLLSKEIELRAIETTPLGNSVALAEIPSLGRVAFFSASKNDHTRDLPWLRETFGEDVCVIVEKHYSWPVMVVTAERGDARSVAEFAVAVAVLYSFGDPANYDVTVNEQRINVTVECFGREWRFAVS